MKLLKPFLLVTCLFVSVFLKAQTPDGELKRWHKLSLTFNGPSTTETSNPNPFSDYRLDVTFTHISSSRSYTVPGYFAACGDAENTGCSSGNKWRVNFAPDDIGAWNWTAVFKSGSNVAINGGGSNAGFMNGATGTFNIAESDKSGKDFRRKNLGRLQYVGEHYLKHTGTNPNKPNGPWFLKVGADSPENRFHYVDFDGTPGNTAGGNKSKTWQAHTRDYVATDASAYTWNGGKGKGLLGSINYLSGQGANVISFLTWAAGGDDGAVFPHILKVSSSDYSSTGKSGQWNKLHKDRFDVSKLAQWEKVMEYADKKGMYLHFKTMETENCEKMDGHTFGRERKLYYRELIARFGHHLALNWNLSEETTLKDEVVKSTVNYIKNLDPYKHHIVLHTYPGQQDQRYNPLIGNKSNLTGVSVQTSQNNVHKDIRRWVINSRNAGRKWVVANDEQGSATQGIMVSDKQVREKVLWATFLAGGAGVEYYSGYTSDDGDLNGQDHRKRGAKYKEGSYALNFFNENLLSGITKMVSDDGITADSKDYVFAEEGKTYAIYRPNGGSTSLSLPSGNNKYNVQWFNPRAGGNLTAKTTLGSNLVAPDNNDWVALVTSKNDDGNAGGCTNNLAATLAQDAYLQGTTRFNNGDLRVESGKRLAYLQFTVPATTKTVTSAKLELTVSSDGGNGLIEVFKGSANSWSEANLSNSNKPSEGVKLGSLNTNYSVGNTYTWNLSNVTPGQTISLIVKQTGGNDVSFSSKEGVASPRLILNIECDEVSSAVDTSISLPGVLEAESFTDQLGIEVENTSDVGGGKNIGYVESGDFTSYKVSVAEAGVYKVQAKVATKTTGGKIKINADGTSVGELTVANTGGWQTWQTVSTTVNLEAGEQTLQLNFTGGSGYLFNVNKLIFEEDVITVEPGNDCVAVEKNGVVAVEAEHFHSQSKDGDRKWYTFNETTTGTPTPDPDANHYNGASGNGYLEILPDTRVTHSDPLNAQSFSNQPGKIAIVDYKVKFTSPGKYFVWVRAHSTGSEDNGVHVGINGTWPASGQKMQWCSGKQQWTWESKQRTNANHCGEPQKIFIDVPSAGVHTISFSMREDGFEMDKFVLSKTYTKPVGSGPEEVLEGCSSSSSRSAAVTLKVMSSEVKVFPNPAQDYITVSGVTTGEQIIVYDFTGNVVLKKVASTTAETLDVSTLKSGKYIIKTQGEKGIHFLKK
ncbi:MULTISPECIES: carbohydrate-binding protein [unclassified Cellulophaga]|uniref:carbohydrate-binding protein n=1 Tax=unclassified Cellulophaga TaxID=2634405 RepID=UPI0026E2418E|nr:MULTISPECIES: carbohydrate-binding protein [unclassified Cellulophaga]MDO6490961.1 carbohydrate-binding protein [Cellulophaga sp. 2_MG-2023]MDO6493845.1 carbohydrate-binding protein [Cellulophaga sp. 3_MG-2023]